MPSLYFAHRREVLCRDGVLLAAAPVVITPARRTSEKRLVRFRTIGDITCTGAVESAAATVDEIIAEVATARVTERAGRADDQRAETAMEDRKREGYF